jgi:hypothetical protein
MVFDGTSDQLPICANTMIFGQAEGHLLDLTEDTVLA